MTRPSVPFVAGLAVILLLLPAVVAPRPVLGQVPGTLLVHYRNHDPLVAVAVRFPTGSRSDPVAGAGATFLFGRVLEEEGSRRIADLGAHLEVEVDRERTLLTLWAPADRWEDAWARVQGLANSPSVPQEAFREALERHRSRLIFESGAPGRSFDVEEAALLFGAGDPGARPVGGSPESIETLDDGAIVSARDRTLDWGSAVVAVVGPVDTVRAEAVFGTSPVRVAAPPPRSPPSLSVESIGAAGDSVPELPPVRIGLRSETLMAPAASGGAWVSGDRQMMNRELTSTWITLAWPMPGEVPLVLEEFLVHLIREALNPDPPNPGVYWAEVDVVRVSGDPVLRVSGSVDPRNALDWEQAVLVLVDELGESPPQGSFFDLARRRYRALRVLTHARPEERARWMAESYARAGSVPHILEDIWGLSREGIARLADTLGDPRILLYGPESLMDPARSP